MGYGVIGSPADSGSASLGSSPGTPALLVALAVAGRMAPLCSGLARRPLKAVARVRIPSGLQHEGPAPVSGAGPSSCVARRVIALRRPVDTGAPARKRSWAMSGDAPRVVGHSP